MARIRFFRWGCFFPFISFPFLWPTSTILTPMKHHGAYYCLYDSLKCKDKFARILSIWWPTWIQKLYIIVIPHMVTWEIGLPNQAIIWSNGNTWSTLGVITAKKSLSIATSNLENLKIMYLFQPELNMKHFQLGLPQEGIYPQGPPTRRFISLPSYPSS